MTQELVLIALLSGLGGLLWVMRLAIADDKRSSEPHNDSDASGAGEDISHGERALKQQTIAA